MLTMKEAILYKETEGSTLQCEACAHRCTIEEGRTGICKVRRNIDGKLYTLTYDKIVATHVDPIEKKPLFHYKPGSASFSIATVGCNFKCSFCQNHDISQWMRDSGGELPGQSISPENLALQARDADCATLAFTYTEPTIYAELALETARAAAKYGIDSIFVTNGFMTSEFLETFGGLIKGANVDLKAFREESYRSMIGGRLEPVLESIRRMSDAGVWLEITTLLIPGFNDSSEELTGIAEFIAGVGAAIPWHISAFHPDYRMRDRGRTENDSLHRAYHIGKAAGLQYVYVGNAMGDRHESTICPACEELVIERYGFQVLNIRLLGNSCASCGEPIEGVY